MRDIAKRNPCPGLPRLLLLCLVLTSAWATAQPAHPDAGPGATELSHESEAETITKCLRDLGSADVGTRRRAALILGKYRAPRAVQAIIGCLEDPDELIRQSALVSLSEERTFTQNARKPVFALIGDPNVHLRRIASSCLRDLLQATRRGTGIVINGRTLGGTGASTRTAPAEVKILNQGLLDEDAIVRKNLLAVAPYLVGMYQQAPLADCLNHPDREVRLLAIRAVGYGACQNFDPTAVLTMTSDPDEAVRAEVVRVVGQTGTPGLPILEKFLADPSPTVRTAALQKLARHGGKGLFPTLRSTLVDDTIPADTRATLVHLLRGFGADGLELLRTLAGDGPVAVRSEALRAIGFHPEFTDTDFLLACLDDRSTAIRQGAAQALRLKSKLLDASKITPMQESHFPEVRRLCLQLSSRLPAGQAAVIVTDSFLDDDFETRTLAVTYAAKLKIADWETLLRDSLDDPDPRMPRAVVRALLEPLVPGAEGVLLPYARKALSAAEPETRQMAFEILRALPASPDMKMDTLAELAQDPSAAIRAQAAGVLGAFGVRAQPLLRTLARDQDSSVRLEALQQLLRAGEGAAVGELGTVILDESIPLSQRSALLSQVRKHGEKAVDLLREVAEKGETTLRRDALSQLVMLRKGCPNASFFAAFLTDPNASIRRTAGRGLDRQRSGVTTETAEELLRSPFSDVRETGVRLLPRFAWDQIEGLMSRALSDPVPRVRATAVRYAVIVSPTGWEKAVRRGLDDPAMDVQRATIQALASRREPQAVALLEAYVKDNPPTGMEAYARAQLAQMKKRLSPAPSRFRKP